VIVDPGVFGDRRRLLDEIGALIGYVKSARPRPGFDEVLVPGEPEQRCRAERLARGIEVDERTWAEILDAARSLGLADHQIDALIV
jgi:hydroxycarboxylate dehydrogenase B